MTNPAIAHVLQFFECGHLPVRLRDVAVLFQRLAQIIASGPQNQETVVALRKLLEAKDAAVRVVVCEPDAEARMRAEAEVVQVRALFERDTRK